MKLIKIRNTNFFFELFENNSTLPYYFDVHGLPSSFYNRECNITELTKEDTVIVNCIPSYLKITKKNIIAPFGFYEKNYRLGFAMDFRKFSLDREYLKNQLGKKVYKNLRQDIQRFERDFSIGFEIFYGDISKEKYNVLMNTLESFIRGRFQGRTAKHVALKRWNFYLETVYQMILDKKASLFVISEKGLPIAISLQYHLKNILYAAIISFDGKFSRYSMGKQMFVKQISWCFQNGYQILDLGWGEYDYKVKFSNAVYRYHTHVLYPKHNLLRKLMAYIILWFLYGKYYIKIILDRKFKRPESKFENRWLKDFEIS